MGDIAKEMRERVKSAFIAAIGEQSGCNSDRCCRFCAEEVIDCKLGVTVDDLTDAAIVAIETELSK